LARPERSARRFLLVIATSIVEVLQGPFESTQYASEAFRDQLAEYQMVQSMSRHGNCYDNAPMESFFSSLKGEYLEHQHFRSHAQARAAIFTYVETFYNPVRLHSSIGYRTPNQFESTLGAAA
jgi:transposase InsO family protein